MKKQLYLVVLVLFFATLYASSYDAKLDTNGDSAGYITLAQNMANGLGYSSVGVDGVTPVNFFPVGYPFILSVMVSMGLGSLTAIKILSGLFMLASVVLVYLMVSHTTESRPLGFVVAALGCMSPQLLTFACMPMSEMSYMFFSFLTLYSLLRLSRAEDSLRSPWFWVAVLSAVASYYIRTIGASLFVAIGAYMLFRGRWLQLGVSVLSVGLLTSLWSLRNASLGLSSRYLGTIMTVNPWRPEEGQISTFGELLAKMVKNFDETVIKGFCELIFPYIPVSYEDNSGFIAVVLGVGVLCIVLYGLWQMGPINWALWGFMAGNIALFMLWHGGNGSRYVTPLTPLIVAGFWMGIYSLLCRQLRSRPKWLAYLLLVAALPMVEPVKTMAQMADMPYAPEYENYITMAKEVGLKVPKGAVVCSRKPEIFQYFAPATINVRYKYTLDGPDLIRDLIARRVDYVVLEQLGYSSTYRYLLPAVQSDVELFPVVWHLANPDTYLMAFDRKKAVAKYGAAQ